jgi:hypothetical protein
VDEDLKSKIPNNVVNEQNVKMASALLVMAHTLEQGLIVHNYRNFFLRPHIFLRPCKIFKISR